MVCRAKVMFFSVCRTYFFRTLFIEKKSNRLHWLMQSVAIAYAAGCRGTCSQLHRPMQPVALINLVLERLCQC